MSIFSETVCRAIGDYRQLLRRYLPQSERVKKIAELNLKDPNLYKDDIALYHTAKAIIQDVADNLAVPEQGYYSYSGITKFCEYLKEYVDNYELEGGEVIHRAQKASRAMVKAIQLAALPQSRLNDEIAYQLSKCNKVIADYGSEEQHELYLENLERRVFVEEAFYKPLVDDFKRRVAFEVHQTEAAG